MFRHSEGQTKASSLVLSSTVITMDTWCSVFKDVTLPERLPSSLPGKFRVGLSGSFLAPGRRLERTSSDTGNKATKNQSQTIFRSQVRKLNVIELFNE